MKLSFIKEPEGGLESQRPPNRIVMSLSIFAVLSAPLQGLMPFFASDVLHAGPRGLGVLLASLGAGAITGAFLLGQLPQYYPRHHLIPLSMLVLGFFAILYSQSTSLPASCICFSLPVSSGSGRWFHAIPPCNFWYLIRLGDA